MPTADETPASKRRRTAKGLIKDEQCRRVSFCKRRDGLFHKLRMLCEEHPGTEAAAFVVSETGVVHFFVHPPASSVLHRFLAGEATLCSGTGDADRESLQELERLEEVVKAVRERLERS